MGKLLVNNVSIFIYALLSTFFISFTITDNFISLVMSVSGAALIQTGMLALFFIMYKKILAKCFTSRNIWFTVLAVIVDMVFSASSVMGKFYIVDADFAAIFATDEHARAKMVLVFAGAFIFFYMMLKAVNAFTELVPMNIPEKLQKVFGFLFDKHCFLKSFIIMTVCWIPHIVIHYPVTIPFDGINSLRQYYGVSPYSTKRSIIHTQLLGHFADLGNSIGSIEKGLFLLGLIQALVMLLILAHTIFTMEKLKLSRYFQAAALVAFSIVPVFAGYSTTLLGDIPYSIALLLLMDELAWYLFKKEEYLKKWRHPILTICAVLGAFFRQNGVYVIAVIIFFLAIYEGYLLCRRQQKIICTVLILASLIVPLCAGRMNVAWLQNKYGCSNVSTRAMLAMPIQQTSRYLVYHSDDLTADELATIQKVMRYDLETYKEKYNPYSFDGVKNGFNYDSTSEDLKNYMKVWIKLFFRHPVTYVNATLMQNYCLFSPLKTNGKYYSGIYKAIKKIKDPDFKQVYESARTFKEKKKKLHENYYDKFCDSGVFGLYVNQGVMDFLLLAICLSALCRKNGKILLLGLSLLLTLAITFVGPTVLGHMRYTFPILYGMPLLAGIYTKQISNSDEK